MKKANLLLLVIFVFTMILVSSCNKCKCEHDNSQTEIPEDTFCYTDEGRTKEMLNYPEIVKMLKTYDTTRIAPLEKALGYEDSRINNYNFKQFKKYLGQIEKLSKKAKIEITGISFISSAKPNYNNTGKSYQDLIYIPTTTINEKQIAFDPLQSVAQGKLVTFKEMLAKNGYKWIYNTLEEYNQGKDQNYNYNLPITEKSKATIKKGFTEKNKLSGAGNFANLEPPY